MHDPRAKLADGSVAVARLVNNSALVCNTKMLVELSEPPQATEEKNHKMLHVPVQL